MSFVGAFRMCSGTASAGCSSAACIARPYAVYTRFDLGAVARYTVACASASSPSGLPRKWYASFAASVSESARGSASPTSSAAIRPNRRALYNGSAPPVSAAAGVPARGGVRARLLGGRTAQRDDAVLDPREKGVLLGPVEPVDLVTEEDRAPPFVLEAVLGGLDDLAHPSDAFGDGRERLEVAGGVMSNDAGERGLPRARRAPEDARGHVPATDQLAQGLARAEQLLLAEEVVERARAHPGRQWLGVAQEERGLRHGRHANHTCCGGKGDRG